MKKLFLLPLFLFAANLVFSQGVTISVKSSITVELEADRIIYTVPRDPGENSMFGALDMFDEEYNYEEDNNWSLEEIADALARDGYEFKKVQSGNGPKYEVLVTDEEQLNAVKELMLHIGVDGAVTDVSYQDPSGHYEEIFNALSEDANEQANVLAASNGKKVMALISIAEVAQEVFDMGAYMDMFKQGGIMEGMFGLGEPSLTKEYTKELIFTFSVGY